MRGASHRERAGVYYIAAWFIMTTEEPKIISDPGGPDNYLEKAQNGKGNPRKTEPFSWIVFAQAWPDLARFG